MKIEAKTNGSYLEIFEALTFVRLAISKDDTRGFCTCIHYKGGVLAGTDGHRIHTVDLPALSRTTDTPEGAYRIAKLNKRLIELEPCDDKLPEGAWTFTAPAKKTTVINEVLPAPTEGHDEFAVYRLIAKLGVFQYAGRDHGYSYPYLADALYNGASHIYRNETGMLVLHAGDYKAAVMPMRL